MDIYPVYIKLSLVGDFLAHFYDRCNLISKELEHRVLRMQVWYQGTVAFGHLAALLLLGALSALNTFVFLTLFVSALTCFCNERRILVSYLTKQEAQEVLQSTDLL